MMPPMTTVHAASRRPPRPTPPRPDRARRRARRRRRGRRGARRLRAARRAAAGRRRSLVAAVGQVAIDLQPPGAKDVVVALFGTNDKLALELFIVAVALLIGAGLGVLAGRRFALGAAGFAAFGVDRLPRRRSAIRSPTRRMVAVAAAVSVGAGLWILDWLPRTARSRPAARRRARPRPAPLAEMPDWSRRSFLVRAGGVGVGGRRRRASAGRALLERQRFAPAGAGRRAAAAGRDRAAARRPSADLSPTIAGPDPDRHAQRPLLPDRHRAPHPDRRAPTAGRCGSTAWSIARRR